MLRLRNWFFATNLTEKNTPYSRYFISNLFSIANGLNDVTCDASSALNAGYRTASDLHIFIDGTWQFIEVQPAIA